jgi:hypothetical protein
VSIIDDLPGINASIKALRHDRDNAFCATGAAHAIGPMGWCEACSYRPPGWTKRHFTDFTTGRVVQDNPWII